jgi:hypothetical protein
LQIGDLIQGIASTTAIVVAVRWILSAKGGKLPKKRGSEIIYSPKWQLQVLLVLGVGFCAGLGGWILHDVRQGISKNGEIAIMPVTFALLFLWVMTSEVITNEMGLTSRMWGYSRTLRWGDMTGITIRPDGSISLLSASAKPLVIAVSCVSASDVLIDEIKKRTNLTLTQQPRYR